MTTNTANSLGDTPPELARTRRGPPARLTERQRCNVVRALAIASLAAVLVMPDHAANGKETDGASSSDVAEKQTDLKSLRAQIETLRREMTAAEGSRKDSLDQLKDADRSISSAQRDLRQLTVQIEKQRAMVKDLDQQSAALEQRLSAQQAQLAKLLYRQYLRGNPDPLRLLLNGDDPHQVARDLHYLEAIGRARSELLLGIEASLSRQQALTADSRQQAAQLAVAESRQKEEHARLLAQRAQRQATLDKVSEQIATQRREIGSLQRDEKRLTELVERLAKVIAAKAAEAREARREAERQELAQKQLAEKEAMRKELLQKALAQRERARQETVPQKPSPPVAPSPEEAPRARPPAPEPRREPPPDAPAAGGNLARMKGTLRLPTKGSVANRFGTPRQEGSTWKGLFIRAGAGSEVRSIAGGRVVFAEWMRGFGNLLIVDHGSDYLSIYAYNDSLLKQVGQAVKGGETIATAGNSGGNQDSGLYFELRHQGQPIDPMKWASLK